MIAPIASKVIKRVPYVGPVIQGVGIALDAKEIVESSTPSEIFIAKKCVMFLGGVVTSVSIGGNPLVVSETLSAARSIIKDL